MRHQRAANRHLAEKLAKLEDKLAALEGGELLLQPSQVRIMGEL